MKQKPKAAAIALTAAILLSSIPPVFADDAAVSVSSTAAPAASSAPSGAVMADAKLSKEDAVRLARKLAGISDDYTLQNVSFNAGASPKFGPSSEATWSLYFEKKLDDRSTSNASVMLNDENGTLLRFNKYSGKPGQAVYPPKFDLKAAKKAAGELLKSTDSARAANLLYNEEFERNFKTPLSGEINYTFRYDRAVNGVRYPQDYVTLTINGNGDFVAYDSHWSDKITFEPLPAAIPLDKAWSLYQEKQNAALQYLSPLYGNTGNKDNEPILSYTLIPYVMDAQTGTLLTEQSRPVSGSSWKPITDTPLASRPAENQNLTKEQAAAKAAALIEIPANAVLQYASFNENYQTKFGGSAPTWNLSWQFASADGKGDDYIQAAVNSSTGELLNYYRRGRYPVPMPADAVKPGADGSAAVPNAMTLEAAQTAAAAFIKKALPHMTSQLAPDPQSAQLYSADRIKETGTISVSFRRVINGIATEYEGVNLELNAYTGEIRNFGSNLSRINYPEKPTQTIGADKAEEKLLSRYTLELNYFTPIADYYGPQPAAADSKASLVYRPVLKDANLNLYLDAVTGEWKNRETGLVVVPGPKTAADLQSHWAKQELQLMIEYDAIDVKDGKVQPDKAITRGEMIKMLIIAMNGGYGFRMYDSTRKASFADVASSSPYFNYVENAVDNNIIDPNEKNFNPDSLITREELAVLLVRGLGYNALAENSSLFNLKAADAVAIKHKGQVALVTGLGIMTTDDAGSFLPAQQVSRAQAAVAFYRYLQKRPMLQDGPFTGGMGKAE